MKKEKLQSKAEIEEQLAQDMLRLSMADLLAEETEDLPDGAEAFISQNRRKTIAVIRSAGRKEKTKHVFLHAVPRVLNAAACLIAVLAIGFGTAVAAVPEVRVKVMELLVNIGENYTEVSVQETEDAFDVPERWPGEYFISDMPEGFYMTHSSGSWQYCTASYETKEGRKLNFTLGTVNSMEQIYTYGAEFTQAEVNGRPATVAAKEGRAYVIWSEYRYYMVLCMDGTVEEAIHVAESVVRVQ